MHQPCSSSYDFFWFGTGRRKKQLLEVAGGSRPGHAHTINRLILTLALLTDNSVPIILPKNYLDLYNFGFAESHSMPKISEGMIGLVALDVTIFGRGDREQLKGRIAGFSNRINTILVPETFMT
jgi:hypothetical protein